jgi:histone-lysine N-methyltransferase SETMAR
LIYFLFLEGLKAKEIHERMLKVYKDSTPSISTVERWVAEFKRGRTSLEDDPRQGRPKTAVTPEIVEKIQDIVLENRRVTERHLVEALGISLGSVSNILTEVLGFRKLCAQWVPHSLTMEQKHIRMRLSQQHLERFLKNKVDFVRRFITMDETWVYHHDPESKQEAKEWCEPGTSAPKRVRVQKSAKKVLASVFWDAKGILFVDYLQTGKTINSEYYCNLLVQLKENKI